MRVGRLKHNPVNDRYGTNGGLYLYFCSAGGGLTGHDSVLAVRSAPRRLAV